MAASERPPRVPPLPVVERRSLYEQLAAGHARGITLVAAPAGSGKTVLVESWLAAAGLRDRTAWVSVDRDERDPQHFWLAVVGALRTAAGIEGPIEELGPAPGFDGGDVVERIISGSNALDEPVILVIDDLHELTEPGAISQLDMLLARRPPQLRVLLSTRHDTPLALHRLRLAGELTEVRATDLHFSLDEAARLFADAGVAIDPADLETLVVRTEGWAAGLRLAALSLAGHSDPQRFVREFSGSERTVAEYLFAEVLERQPGHVRQLLLRTSILDRVSGPLADHLLGTTGSERFLLDLERAGMFVYAADPARAWFRYHNLFTDLLRLELRRTAPTDVSELHRRAAEWHAEHGSAVEAIRHAQAAGDWRLAADLVGQHGFSIALDGSFATMRALLAAFPPAAFDTPLLAAFLAYGEVLRPSLESAAAYIALAERRATEVRDDQRPVFAAMLAIAQLTLARWRGDFQMALREVRPLLEPSPAESAESIAVGNDARAVAIMSLGIVELWAGWGEDAERHLVEAAELARRIGRPYVEQGCLAHLALAIARRSFGSAREPATQALGILERYGWMSEPVVPMLLATIGGFDVVQGRCEDAEAWLDRAERQLRPNAEPAKELLVRYIRGLQRMGQGRIAEADAQFDQTHRLQSHLVDPNPLAIAARGLQVQLRVRRGDLAAAREALVESAPPTTVFADTRIALAAIQVADRDPRAAVASLAPVLAEEAPVVIQALATVNALMVDATAREMLGDARGAEDAVERALDVAEPDGLILPFLITPARELLERHPRHRTAHAALLGDILDALGGVRLPTRRSELPVLAEDLTESEIRVLRYLPSNLSAPEIAGELFLSTSTVKTHMRHIYDKLGAHKRTEAVEQARALGLLGPSAGPRRPRS